MPQPSKEDFAAASAKVGASAPPGLTQEQFYALVDQELAHQPVSGGPESYWSGVGASLADTAGKTLSGVGEGALAAVNPMNIVRGVKAFAGSSDAELLAGLKSGASNVGGFVKDAVTGNLEPERGGQAIGALGAGLVIPKVAPSIVRGVRAIAPTVARGAGAAADVGVGATTGALKNLPIVGPTLKGMWKGASDALDERAIANIDNPANVSRAQQAVASARTPAVPPASGFDPYMPNTSAPKSAGFGPAASTDVPTLPQGTYTKLPDDSWGISGTNLQEGQPVHVMNRAGSGQLHAVDKILSTADGKQLASIKAFIQELAQQSPTAADASRLDLSAADSPNALADALEKLRQQAVGRTYPNPQFVPKGLESSYPGQGR